MFSIERFIYTSCFTEQFEKKNRIFFWSQCEKKGKIEIKKNTQTNFFSVKFFLSFVFEVYYYFLGNSNRLGHKEFLQPPRQTLALIC